MDGNLHPSRAKKPSINGANTTTCKPCQLSAVSRQLSAVVHFAQGATPLGHFQRSKNTTIYTVFVLRILLAPLLLPLIPSLCTTHTLHCICSTTIYIYIRHPLCIRFATIIYQTHTIYQSSHHYLSATCSISRAPFLSLFKRFRRAPPRTTIYTLFLVYSHTAHTT